MKVSVCMMAFNHERFISQAIDGVLMQQTAFDFELVIGEDCSTDRTRDIARDYQQRNPERIRLLLSEKNLGMMKNWVRTFAACRGELVALLDGDDYWTSPHKLQKQVDFLDSHPECALCFHPVRKYYEDGSREPWNNPGPGQKEITTIEDILKGNFIETCSAMLRRGPLGEIPDWFQSFPMEDWPIYILSAHHGKIGYINEVMGTQRIHPTGIWSSKSNIDQLRECISVLKIINAHLPLSLGQQRILGGTVYNFLDFLALIYEREGDLANARACTLECMKCLGEGTDSDQ